MATTTNTATTNNWQAVPCDDASSFLDHTVVFSEDALAQMMFDTTSCEFTHQQQLHQQQQQQQQMMLQQQLQDQMKLDFDLSAFAASSLSLLPTATSASTAATTTSSPVKKLPPAVVPSCSRDCTPQNSRCPTPVGGRSASDSGMEDEHDYQDTFTIAPNADANAEEDQISDERPSPKGRRASASRHPKSARAPKRPLWTEKDLLIDKADLEAFFAMNKLSDAQRQQFMSARRRLKSRKYSKNYRDSTKTEVSVLITENELLREQVRKLTDRLSQVDPTFVLC